MECAKESIEALEDELQSVFERFEQEYEELGEFAYGAEDNGVLVLIASENGSPDFRKEVSGILTEVGEKPVGMVLASGPEQYSENTAAYIRKNPEHAYEYLLGLCSAIGLDDDRIRYIFQQGYLETGGEGEDEALPVAVGFLYAKTSDETSVEELSDVSGLSKGEIRDYALEVTG